MKVIEIKVNSIRENEEVVANLIVEQRKGDGWNRTKLVTVTSGTPEATRKLSLEDNERLVIEGQTTKKVVYDREQNMSKIVDEDPQVRQKQEAAEKAQLEANVEREQRQREVQQGLKEQADREAPKTNLGNPVLGTPQGDAATKPLEDKPVEPVKTPEPVKPVEPAKQGSVGGLATGGTTPQTTQTPAKAGDHGQGAAGTKEVKK